MRHDKITTSYKITKPNGELISLFDTLMDVSVWEVDNSKQHPDWQITRYKVIQIVTVETQIR